MADLEQMKQIYASVLNLINQSGVRLSHMHIQDNKFFLQGSAGSEEIKNRLWDQIKPANPAADDYLRSYGGSFFGSGRHLLKQRLTPGRGAIRFPKSQEISSAAPINT